MPGIPLLNLGTALGGLAGGWNQARSQGLQQAIQQFALQQAQGQTNSQTLASLALQLGLMNQPGGGQTPLQAATGAVPNQTAPAPTPSPMGGGPQVSPSSGMPMPQGYTYTPPVPGGAQPGYAPDLSLNTISSADETQLNADASEQDQSQFGATDQAIAASSARPSSQAASSGGSDTTPAQKSMPTITSSPGQIAPGGMQSGGNDSGQQSGGGGVGMQFGNGPPIDMSTMFQRLDYQKLAQGIAQLAPPGTSQADIYGAVVDLAKLADGDKTQQQQAAYMLKLLGIQGRMVEIGQQQGGAMARVEAQQAGAGQRTAAQQAGANQRATMADQTRRYIADQTAQIKRDAATAKNANDAARIAQRGQALATALQGAQRQDASLQIRARVDRINAIRAAAGSNDLNEDQQKQVQMLSDQIDSLANKAAADQGAGP